MKLLITTGDFSRHLTPNSYDLFTEVSKLSDLTLWHESGNIQDIIHHLGISPDFILINEFEETNSPKISGLAGLSIPYAVSLHDLHYMINPRKELMAQENVRYVFTLYRDKFYEWYPQFWQNMYWLPHHVDTDVFKDYGLARDIDLLLMGAVHKNVYPLRYKILEKMKNKPGFIYHPHPGYKNFTDEERATLYIGKNYAREINRAKMFLTCDSKYRYPLAKYFEILACKTLLLAPFSRDLADLGFIPGTHFVPIDGQNFQQKADYYLHHEKERQEIAEQGYEMVRSRHSTSRRAAQFIDIIENIRRDYYETSGYRTQL